MHRFTVDTPLEAGMLTTLSAEESHHAVHVLRLSAGENVCLIDGEHLWNGVIESCADGEVTVRVTEACAEPEGSVQITLWQGLPKADKMEWIVQKCTELGVARVLPVETERSIVRIDPKKETHKNERLQRIAQEAAKQSGRARVPEVKCAVTWREALKAWQADPDDLLLVAWEEEHTLLLSEAIRAAVQSGKPLKRATVFIGPEGGISEKEWQQLRALGAVAVSLGRRILRTETAGLCALSVIWAALGEM